MSAKRVLRAVGVFLVAAAVLAYVGYLVVYVVYAVNLFRWPFDYDQGEGFELYDALLYSQGEWPYRDSGVYPYYASNYPPLFHLLIVPLLPILGSRVMAGRVVSFLATLVTAATIGVMVRRRMGRDGQDHWQGWFLPVVSGLAFTASNYVYLLGPLCRMHMTMVMFETLAIAFIAEFDHPRRGKRNLILGLVMLLCAGYTKQMAVFTVAAALFYVFIRDVKKAIAAGAVLAAVAGIIFWLLNVATGGQWWVNTIQANVNAFDYLDTLFYFRQWFRLHALLVLPAAGYLLYELIWGRLSAYSLWFFFALGTGALSGKWGAGYGYFSTAVAAVCLTSGLALGRLWDVVSRWSAAGKARPGDERRGAQKAGGADCPSTAAGSRTGRAVRAGLARVRPWAPALLAILIPLLYLLQAPRMLHLPTSGPVFGPLADTLGVENELIQGNCATFQYHDSMGYTQLGHLLTPGDYEAGYDILDYALTSDGPVFSEEAMFSILAGEPVVTNPTQLLNLYNNNLLDTTDIIARINRQEFGVVIFRAQFYPDPVLQAIGQNYQPVDSFCMNGFDYYILWPYRRLESETGF